MATAELFRGTSSGEKAAADYPAYPVAPISQDDTPSRAATQAYRRKARRLRQQYAGHPQVLHQRLCELSRKEDLGKARWARFNGMRIVSRVGGAVATEVTTPRQVPGSGPKRIVAVAADGSTDSPFARAVVDWFADQVAGQFSGQLLHQSQRLALLKTAERLGIARFHANLIIAVAQHDANEQGDARRVRLPASARRFSWTRMMLIAGVQLLIIWGAWHVLHG